MKILLIKYSDIVSLSIQQYIEENESSFLKEENRYILVKPFKIKTIHTFINNTIASIIPQMNSDVVYIIGECYHYNNWRLPLVYTLIKNGCKTLVDKKTPIKYILKERDIKIDELMLNHITEIFFNNNFKKSKDIKYIKHRNLTEDDIVYIFKSMFSTNILNIFNLSSSKIQKTNNLIYDIGSDKTPKKYQENVSNLIDSQISGIL